MTDKLYTQSDMEALRERCAKVADAYQGYDDALQRSAGCKTAGENVAKIIRALPLHPEGEKP